MLQQRVQDTISKYDLVCWERVAGMLAHNEKAIVLSSSRCEALNLGLRQSQIRRCREKADDFAVGKVV